MDQSEQTGVDFASITANIISSYVANNSFHRNELPAVIASVHMALQSLVAPQQVGRAKPQPAVAVRKSVTPDFLISLEDGKPYKSLKRHLTRLGLTPQAYREKWSLPPDYPMVASNYALQRSQLAKSMGLCEKRSKLTAAEAAVEFKEEVDAAPAEASKPKRRTAANKGKGSE
jgi:predicted transcriptional regulator